MSVLTDMAHAGVIPRSLDFKVLDDVYYFHHVDTLETVNYFVGPFTQAIAAVMAGLYYEASTSEVTTGRSDPCSIVYCSEGQAHFYGAQEFQDAFCPGLVKLMGEATYGWVPCLFVMPPRGTPFLTINEKREVSLDYFPDLPLTATPEDSDDTKKYLGTNHAFLELPNGGDLEWNHVDDESTPLPHNSEGVLLGEYDDQESMNVDSEYALFEVEDGKIMNPLTDELQGRTLVRWADIPSSPFFMKAGSWTKMGTINRRAGKKSGKGNRKKERKA